MLNTAVPPPPPAPAQSQQQRQAMMMPPPPPPQAQPPSMYQQPIKQESYPLHSYGNYHPHHQQPSYAYNNSNITAATTLAPSSTSPAYPGSDMGQPVNKLIIHILFAIMKI